MPLTQEQFNTLHYFVYHEAFDADDLYETVRLKLGADMYKEWVGTGMPFNETVLKLIDKLQSPAVHMIVPFIDMVLSVRANKSGIEVIRAIRDSLNESSMSTTDQTTAITRGVAGVADKLQLAPVRKVVVESEGVLSALSSEIELLRAYKTLHDALHNARMQFRSLETSARQMAANSEAAEDFGQAVMAMETLAASVGPMIQDLPSEPSGMREDEYDWLRRFTDAIALTRQAADACDPVTARQGVQGVRSVLGTEPSRIDRLLSRSANNLELAKLKDVFSAAAAVPELAPEAPTLEAGRVASEQLLREVRAQVNQHSLWQEIERQLARADEIMRELTPQQTWDFDGMWKGLKEATGKLISLDVGSEWAKKIDACLTNVNALRATEDWPKLRPAFARFRQETTVQFFVVDINLKTIAGQIDVIGAPLRNLLAQL